MNCNSKEDHRIMTSYFSELSCPHCDENDLIVVPNIPLFGAFQKIGGESQVKIFFAQCL